jgi:hypothetical protein
MSGGLERIARPREQRRGEVTKRIREGARPKETLNTTYQQTPSSQIQESHYSYDVHGNVKSMLQVIRGDGEELTKRIDYESVVSDKTFKSGIS